MLTQCPLNLASPGCSEVYNLVKSTLMSEMGTGGLPSQLLEELNILFIYKEVIQRAENTSKKE